MNGQTTPGNVSPGCRCCQNGKWVCIFLTYQCNAKCGFCASPWKQQDKITSAFGSTPSQVLSHIEEGTVDGISFSGGDCFLVYDRLVEWLSYFKKRRSGIYYWAYTNGLAADKSKLAHLAKLGLNEIRYNIAATGYDSPSILEQIRFATRLFQKVAVEIPSIPADYENLIRILPYLDAIGVAYLNLHEYILVGKGLPSQKNTTGTFLLNKDTVLRYHVRSLRNTTRIASFRRRRGLTIGINNCTLRKKENQMLLRRLAMGRMFQKSHERLRKDGLLETVLLPPVRISDSTIAKLLETEQGLASLERYCVHPAQGKQLRRVRKLLFMPPLGIDGRRVLLRGKE